MFEKINKIMMLSLITSVLIVNTMPVLGYDANNPASYTVQFIIPSDTSFAVNVIGNQLNMQFNPANKSSKLVEPNGQSIATNQPWANITNLGNLNLNFSTNLTTLNPVWAELDVGSNPSMADKIIVTNTPLSPVAWLNVAPDSTVQLYSQANFTNAAGGTTSETINIYSTGS